MGAPLWPKGPYNWAVLIGLVAGDGIGVFGQSDTCYGVQGFGQFANGTGVSGVANGSGFADAGRGLRVAFFTGDIPSVTRVRVQRPG